MPGAQCAEGASCGVILDIEEDPSLHFAGETGDWVSHGLPHKGVPRTRKASFLMRMMQSPVGPHQYRCITVWYLIDCASLSYYEGASCRVIVDIEEDWSLRLAGEAGS